jgi:hypothetical protein
MAVGALIESAHAMPTEARNAAAGALALSNTAEARSAAVLFLLDPDRAVRGAVAEALVQVAASLTPTDVRRLIAMRNWRSENERAEVDAIIRKARTAGIQCAQWETGRIEAILATCIDGSGSQAFVVISPAGRKRRMSSLLTKAGVADAMSGEPETLRRIEASLAGVGTDAPSLAVAPPYLDRNMAHHLALTTERGEVPPLGLLQVAETIGGADWQPARMDFSEMLAGLLAEVPKAMCDPAAVTSVLRTSDRLTNLGLVAQSWFEDDPEAARTVERARGRDRAKLAAYLLQSVIARRRDRWADLTLRTALWMREAPAETGLCWRELAIIAKALADGRDMTEIGLMRTIALRTIMVLGDARRRRGAPQFAST